MEATQCLSIETMGHPLSQKEEGGEGKRRKKKKERRTRRRGMKPYPWQQNGPNWRHHVYQSMPVSKGKIPHVLSDKKQTVGKLKIQQI